MKGASLHDLSIISKIFDDLYLNKINNNLTKSMIFIVGDGIYPVNNIVPDKSRKKLIERKKLKFTKFEEYKRFTWHQYQYAKYYTENYIPSFCHYFISRLVCDGICKNVITTNYDLFFDTIWKRNQNIKILQNPVLSKGEYNWEDYYSIKSKSKDASYWKIHGSLSHVVFKQKILSDKKCIFRLPKFIVSSNRPSIQNTYRMERIIPNLAYEQHLFPNTRFNNNHKDYQKEFLPYIDWSFNNDRKLFKEEIKGAKSILKQPKSIAAIVLIGFSGFYKPDYHPRNEEIIEDLLKLMANGFNNIFMAVSEKQFKKVNSKRYNFMKSIHNKKKCWVYKDSDDFINGILMLSNKMQLSDFWDEYRDWQQFYLTGKELQPMGRK